ncbi:MAG: AMP-binding protein [Bacillaceae bacterium]
MDFIVEKPWLKHYPSEIPHQIDFEAVPLQHYLKRTAQLFPDKKAIHFIGKEVTFKEVYESALKLANYLRDLGIKQGDRVAIMLPNCPQAVIGYYGVLFAGGIVVQTNPLYTERELQYQLQDSGATAILCLDLLFPRVNKVQSSTEVKHIIVTGIADYLPFPKNLLYPFVQKKENNLVVKVEHKGNCHLFKVIMKSKKMDEINLAIDIKEDIALLQYTGGTTGFPKGVMLTHYNLVSNAMMAKKWLYQSKTGEETVLGVLPFFHVFGMTAVMNLCMVEGHKMVLVPKFVIKDILEAIKKHRPTFFPGAPTMYIGLLNHPDLKNYDLSSIKACISGSAPLPVDVQEKFEKITGGKLVEGYGLTESSPVTHANFVWNKRVNGSIGVPWPSTEAAIFSMETGEPVPTGEIGELAVRGPQVMKGYWNRPEETAAILKDGWLFTGDLGYMDTEGFFYIVDRKKDMIIAGGFNIYPREVEEVLYENPKVLEAVVAGVPDAYRGETVKAYIVLKEGEQMTEEELNQYCRQYLAAYKVPRIYEFRKELPKTAIGKILRRALVDEEKSKLEGPSETTIG